MADYIYGSRSIIEALDAGQTLEKVFVDQEHQSDLSKELYNRLKEARIKWSTVPVQKLESLAKGGNHQGVVARVSAIEFADLETILDGLNESDPVTFLITDGVTDVRNLGAMIRTASCTGVTAVIVPAIGNAPINMDAIKTSAGAAYTVPICRPAHIKDALFQLQASEVTLCAASEKSDSSIYEHEFTPRTAIIMGSEERGVHKSVLGMCDARLRLPIVGPIGSLNVSVAAGAILFERVRQLNLSK